MALIQFPKPPTLGEIVKQRMYQVPGKELLTLFGDPLDAKRLIVTMSVVENFDHAEYSYFQGWMDTYLRIRGR